MKKVKGSAAVWVVWIILTILVVGGLIYWFQFKKIPELNKKIDDLQDQVNQLQEQAQKPADETADWKTYTNTKYGFKLTFVDVWKDYQVIETPSNDKFSSAYLRVWVPTTDASYSSGKKGFANPITFSIYAAANWTKQQKESGPIPTLVGTTDNYTIGYSTWQDSPTDLTDKFAGTVFKDLINSFEKI
jgi:hypothetical protein